MDEPITKADIQKLVDRINNEINELYDGIVKQTTEGNVDASLPYFVAQAAMLARIRDAMMEVFNLKPSAKTRERTSYLA